ITFDVATCAGAARLANPDARIDVLATDYLKPECDAEMARRLRRAPSFARIAEKEAGDGLAWMRSEVRRVIQTGITSAGGGEPFDQTWRGRRRRRARAACQQAGHHGG